MITEKQKHWPTDQYPVQWPMGVMFESLVMRAAVHVQEDTDATVTFRPQEQVYLEASVI